MTIKLTREEAIQDLEAIKSFERYARGRLALDMAIEALQTDIVHCEECRHAYYADNRVPHERTWVCERFMNEEINANDFCSWGERKE